MKGAVSGDDTVAAERIVRWIIIVEVTTKYEYMVSAILCRINRPPERLVNEIPDKSALIRRILADKIPILLQASE